MALSRAASRTGVLRVSRLLLWTFALFPERCWAAYISSVRIWRVAISPVATWTWKTLEGLVLAEAFHRSAGRGGRTTSVCALTMSFDCTACHSYGTSRYKPDTLQHIQAHLSLLHSNIPCSPTIVHLNASQYTYTLVGLEYGLVSLGLHCFLRLERALCWRSGRCLVGDAFSV